MHARFVCFSSILLQETLPRLFNPTENPTYMGRHTPGYTNRLYEWLSITLKNNKLWKLVLLLFVNRNF